jgi:hypothetical protein
MEPKQTKSNYLTYGQIITLAKQAGVDFGKGYPYNRLRYYTKIGLLPKAERKSFGGNPEGCYPEWVVDKLVEINRKIKDGSSVQSILREKKSNFTQTDFNLEPPPLPQPSNIIRVREPVSTIQETPPAPPETIYSPTPNFLNFTKTAFAYSFIVAIFLGVGMVALYNLPQTHERAQGVGSFLSDRLASKPKGDKVDEVVSDAGSVLARTTAPYLKINVETEIDKLLNATGGVDTAGADADLGTGELTASNVIYDVLAGDNVNISEGQTPTISVPDVGGGIDSVSGTSGRITVSGTTDPTVNIATTYTGQTSITTLGTIGTGTWNGTSISDAFVDNNLTISGAGSVTWTALTGYPAAADCGAGNFVRVIADDITCAADVGGTSTLQGVYDNDVPGGDAIIELTTLDDSLIFKNPAAAGTDSGYILQLDQLNTGSVDALQIAQSGLGDAIDITATYDPSAGGTQSAVDINLTNSPTLVTNTLRGVDIDIDDATDSDSTVIGYYADLDINGFDGAQTVYGLYADVSATGGLTSPKTAYGAYLKATTTFAAVGETTYGLFVDDAGGSDSNYALYVADQTGGNFADYGLYIEDADTASIYLASTDNNTPSGIGFASGDVFVYRDDTDRLAFSNNILVGDLSTSNNDYAYFDQNDNQYLAWDDISDADIGQTGENRFELSTDLSINGNLDVSSHGAIGTTAAPVAGDIVTISETQSVSEGSGIVLTPTFSTAVGINDQYGLELSLTNSAAAGSASGSLFGVSSTVSFSGAGALATPAELIALYAQYLSFGTGNPSEGYGLYVDSPNLGTPVIQSYGARVDNQGGAGVTDSYGLYVESQTGSTNNYGVYIADAADYSLYLASTDQDPASGITFGGDTNLYRGAANQLHTDNSLYVAGNVDFNSNVDITQGLAERFLLTSSLNTLGGTVMEVDFNSNIGFTGSEEHVLAINTLGGGIGNEFNDSNDSILDIVVEEITAVDILDVDYQTGLRIIAEGTGSFGSNLANGILITGSGTEGFVTDAIDVSGANITNAMNIGTNQILASGSFTIDLLNAVADDTLTITNSNGGFVANLDVEGDLNIGAGGDVTIAEGRLDITSTANETALSITADSVTNQTGVDISLDGLTSQNGVNIISTSPDGLGLNTSTLLNVARSGINVNLNHFAIGIRSAVTNSANNGVNYAGWFDARSADGSNYALYVPDQTDATGANYGLYIEDADDASIYLESTDNDPASGITLGTDVSIYRDAADRLAFSDNINVGDSADNDDDIIYFDQAGIEYFMWDDLDATYGVGFDISDDLQIDDDLTIGSSSAADSDYIYFDSAQSESFSWDNAGDEFDLTDDMDIAGQLAVGSGSAIGGAQSVLTSETFGDGAGGGADCAFNCSGFFSDVTIDDGPTDTGIQAYYARTRIANRAGLTVTNAYGMLVAPTIDAGSGAVTNAYGISVGDNTVGTTANYGIVIDGGGTYALWVDSDTSRFDGAVAFSTQQTLSIDDATPDVSAATSFITANTGAAPDITDFDAGGGTLDTGQLIFIEFNDANTTIDCDGGNINCGSTDIAMAAGDFSSFFYDGTDWHLVSYMDDSDDHSGGSGFDIAEWFSASEELEPGDLVSIDPEAYTAGSVMESKERYDSNLIGIVSTEPGLTLGEPADGFAYPIALAGRVPIKVSTENGSIKPGDQLTSSSTSGVAMKATKSGPIIGKALDSFDESSVGTIVTFVSVGWYVAPLGTDNATQIAGVDNLALNSLTSNSIILGDNYISVDQNGGIKIDGNLTIAGNIDLTGEIAASSIKTDALSVGSESSGSGSIPSGQSSTIINNSSLGTDSKVIITFNSNWSPATRYWVDKQDGKFEVNVDRPLANNAKFDWIVIGAGGR